MKFKLVVSITAVLTFINGISLLVVPGMFIATLGGSLTGSGLMIARFAGACALGLSLVLWQIRNIQVSSMQRSITGIMLGVMFALLVIDLHGILTGAVNPLGWIIFSTDLLVEVGFLFVLYTGTVKS
jgi:hypothetical protein